MTAIVKGWCPGAHRPMISGDGLIVRVRPFFARLDARQVLGLCALAQQHGNGFLDLTNRANIQIRGVAPAHLEPLLVALGDLGLLDATPDLEARRNIMVTPFWRAGDDTHALCHALMARLPLLPELPAKFGFVIDASDAPLLADGSGDIRIERGRNGLIVRADSCTSGRAVTRETALVAVQEMAEWFVKHRTPAQRRMADVVANHSLPAAWTVARAIAPLAVPVPGPCEGGVLLGAAFGQIDAAALSHLMQSAGVLALRVTPWRLFLLEDVEVPPACDFVTRPSDPLLHVDACPGAPHCASASVATRDLARQLAGNDVRSLHISGCSKGCARKGRADVTIVGKDGRFDLVRKGHAWDAPEKAGLGPEDLMAELTGH